MEDIFKKLEEANYLKKAIDTGDKRLASLRKSYEELQDCDPETEVPVKDSITNRQVFFNLLQLRVFYGEQLQALERDTQRAKVRLKELLT